MCRIGQNFLYINFHLLYKNSALYSDMQTCVGKLTFWYARHKEILVTVLVQCASLGAVIVFLSP